MNIVEAIFLGLIQGLTEFIPVSSSGHLIIAANIMGLETSNTFAFDVTLNIGTLLALIWFFRHKLSLLVREAKSSRRLLKLLAVSTIPAATIGYVFQDLIEQNTRSIYVVIITLVAVGILMILADRFSNDKKIEDIKLNDAIAIGLGQAAALIPGVSRSGITISTARYRSISPKAAAEYSFLLAIPIIMGATIKVLLDGTADDLIDQNLPQLLAGVSASFIGGWVAIGYMIRTITKIGLKWFGVYRILLASLLLLLVVLGKV